MFKIGDKVKLIDPRFTQRKEMIGSISAIQQWEIKQFVRVHFSSKLYDYVDVGSWRVKKA
jgi:hypothetical protein